jgi:hypothetical protein
MVKRLPPDLTRIMRQAQINSASGCTMLDSDGPIRIHLILHSTRYLMNICTLT